MLVLVLAGLTKLRFLYEDADLSVWLTGATTGVLWMWLMDQKAIVGAIVAAAFVGAILIGRIALSRLRGQEIKAETATFSAILVLVALVGLAAGSGLLERILGW